MPPRGVCVIGAGYWGKNHVRLCANSASVSLHAVVEPGPAHAKRVRDQYPSVRVYDSFTDLVADTEVSNLVEAAVVCVPASIHFKVCADVIRSGRHVLVEKPLTLDTDSARQLALLAREKGVRLMVAHTFLFNRAMPVLEEFVGLTPAVKSGSATLPPSSTPSLGGDILYMHSVRTNLGPVRTDTNALWDLATHDVSMFLHLARPRKAAWVTCVGQKLLPDSAQEDVAFVSIGFADSRLIAHTHVSWSNPDKVRRFVVVGTNSRAEFEDTNLARPVHISLSGVRSGQDNDAASGSPAEPGMAGHYMATDGDVIAPSVSGGEPLATQLDSFVESLKNPLDAWPSDADFGVEVVRVLEAAQRSMDSSGARVDV